MRIHTTNTESFIQGLIASISKDPASLENWRCLHIGHLENKSAEWCADALQTLKETNKDIDCEVVHCADGDIFFISRHLQVDELYELAQPFILATRGTQGKAGAVELYDLFRDWRLVREILLSKTSNAPLPTSHKEIYDFGEIASLQEVFNEAKKLRGSRMPLHVMVVEDDLLTRRIVANTFKDNYALINAGNAHEAVANYLMHAPDIVFLDIGLPDASGFDVLQQILATDADAYVVMFSSSSYLDNVTSALTSGASGFVAKPFNKEKMRHYIQDSALHHHKYA